MKKYIIIPFATVSVFTVLTAYNLEKYGHQNFRSIAAEEESKKEEPKKDMVSEIIECHKKAYDDLKVETDKKVAELKKLIEDMKKPDEKSEKKSEEKSDDKKVASKADDNKQLMAILMNLTQVFEKNANQNVSLASLQSELANNQLLFAQKLEYLNSQMNTMMYENTMLRRQYREQPIFDSIGLGQDYLGLDSFSPRPFDYSRNRRMPGGYERYNGDQYSRLYQHPYEVAQDFRPMPIMGESFYLEQGNLIRQPSSRSFSF